MHLRILKLFTSSVLIAAPPALADAQSVAYSAAPVVVTSCTVNESYQPMTNLDVAPQFVADGVTLTFVNKTAIPITGVTFLVNDGQATRSIVDKGIFTPGVRIKHWFTVSPDTSALSDAACKVAEVDFANGSDWRIAPGDVAAR